jgi:hypothetical protein
MWNTSTDFAAAVTHCIQCPALPALSGEVEPVQAEDRHISFGGLRLRDRAEAQPHAQLSPGTPNHPGE